MLRNLHHDAKVLMASRGIRAFAFSYLNVVFAIYLDRLGYSTLTIGIVFSVAYLSGALLTALWGYLSDRYGRQTNLDAAGRVDDHLQRNLGLFQRPCFHFVGGRYRQCRRRRIGGWRVGRRAI